MTFRLRFPSLACLVLLALATVCVPKASAAGPYDDDPVSARVATFEKVWSTVNEKFYDPAFNGVDWQDVRVRYAPRVAAASSDAELYRLLNEMLGELKASHFAILPPSDAGVIKDGPGTRLDTDGEGWGGTAGMTVRLIDGQPTVSAVAENGPADRAGIRPGFLLTRIGDADLAELVARIRKSGRSDQMQRLMARRTFTGLLGGIPGRTVTVGYVDGADVAGTAELVRADVAGTPMRVGEMPSVLVSFETRTLAGNIGYIRFNFFMPALMDRIRRELDCLRTSSGLIIDLRDNPGGIGQMAPGIASLLIDTGASLGTMRMRRGEIRFVTYRQPWSYKGPVVVLTDEGSASTSEILAGSLQELGRVTVVGERTLGAVLPSVVERLPNGAVLQYAVADFKTPKGVLLEGRGVEPDVPVIPTRGQLLAGGDPVLDAAIRVLRSPRTH